ncbi:MAG: folylpolyglutamate synthase/dihydrofolate synthase family protein [Anaerolineales bacterium]
MSTLMKGKLEQFLRELPDLGARRQDSMSAADFTLERIQSLITALGDPQQKYPSLHIAGTNGKGSVAAFCASAFQVQGYKIGRFTSPHLRGALKGISIDGEVVSDIELDETFDQIRPHLGPSLAWTHFEVVTALAFMHFARVGVDAAVIEVGLGGRLDATNVLTPLVSVITPIDFDHTSILGNTLAAIATEKAGIIKADVPVVVSPQAPEARTAIQKIANDMQAPVTEVGRDILFARDGFDLNGQALRVWSADHPDHSHNLRIGLHGAHQVANAATAFTALQLGIQRGLQINQASIEKGFAAARWPGRFEIFQTNPPVVLDTAHSPAAARALRAALDDYFPTTTSSLRGGEEREAFRPNEAISSTAVNNVTVVLGVSADKDLAGLMEPLRPRLAKIVATQSSHPRAMPASELVLKLAGLAFSAQPEPDPAKAVSLASSLAASESVLLCFGSVFLIEQIRETLLAVG